MRITGGKFSGRRITAPKGDISRPTTDRTREALFNILAHHKMIELEGAKTIDLFAGSGALGLEAISWGAENCLFVEEDAHARAAIRDNIEALHLFGHTRIHRRSATSLGKIPASIGGPFTLAFMDPPYRKNLAPLALNSLHQGEWLGVDAHIIIEQAKDEHPAQATCFNQIDHRLYGDTQIGIYKYQYQN